MFFGTYTPRLDDKGRLFLPAKFRDELAEGLVVTRGQERCLYVWSMAEFGKLTERLREAPVTNKAARDYVRMFFAGASDETPDKQGRDHPPADAAGLRVADEGLHRDRRDEPDRDLGRRRVADLLRPAGAGVRGPLGGGLPGCLPTARRPASQDEVSRPLLRPSGTPSPVPEGLPSGGADGDLVRRTSARPHRPRHRPARGASPCPSSPFRHPPGRTPRAGPAAAAGPPRGPRRRGRHRVLGGRLHRVALALLLLVRLAG